MKLNFTGDVSKLLQGIERLSSRLHFTLSKDGEEVNVTQCDKGIRVGRSGNKGFISYHNKVEFYRALGLYLEHAHQKGDFYLEQAPHFTTNGIMIDCSRNAVMKVDRINRILEILAVMGLNCLMLYTEDTYQIEEMPYFGYLRGAYTKEELRACDDYADLFGIELVPCIQTLAHLKQAIKWDSFQQIRDTDDILLVGNEKTYEFIDQLLCFWQGLFRSKKIHLGMDEAWALGSGQYLNQNGFVLRGDIMKQHMDRVIPLVHKYGFEPMIWSDMYVRPCSKNQEYYGELAVKQEDIDRVPKDLTFVYWDYYHHEKDEYAYYIDIHNKLSDKIAFAGGIWTWCGNCVNYHKTFQTTNAALSACKEHAIRHVFATIWGDNGGETNVFTAILGMQLYAEHGYHDEVSDELLKKRFRSCCGANFDAFYDLTWLNQIRPNSKNAETVGKVILYQDSLLGIFDKNIEALPIDLEKHYQDLEDKLIVHRDGAGEWAFLFQFPIWLAHIVKKKAYLGIQLKKAYDERDRKALDDLSNRLKELYLDVEHGWHTYKAQWLHTYKPFGLEVQNDRFGGLMARIAYASERIDDYLAGNIDQIEELEANKLPFARFGAFEEQELINSHFHSICVTAGQFNDN